MFPRWQSEISPLSAPLEKILLELSPLELSTTGSQLGKVPTDQFFWRFRDPIRVPRMENRVPRISEYCNWVL